MQLQPKPPPLHAGPWATDLWTHPQSSACARPVPKKSKSKREEEHCCVCVVLLYLYL